MDVAPYAFVRLADAAVRASNRQCRTIVLVGKSSDDDKSFDQPKQSKEFPLRLCFLLADGRFQPFEAQQLELQFATEEDSDLWSREFGVACENQPAQKKRSVTRASGVVGPSLTQVQGAPPQQPFSSESEPPVSWGDSMAVP